MALLPGRLQLPGGVFGDAGFLSVGSERRGPGGDHPAPAPDGWGGFLLALELGRTGRLGDVRLYDKAGQEISQTFIEGEEPNWGSGKSTAERCLLYVYMALAGLMGLVLVRYFLRRD